MYFTSLPTPPLADLTRPLDFMSSRTRTRPSFPNAQKHLRGPSGRRA